MNEARRIGSQWGAGLLLASSLLTYFLDWHVVHRTNALEGFSLFGHAGKPPPLHDTGVAWTCSGFSHYERSFVLPALLVAWLSYSVLTRRRAGVLVRVVELVLGCATLAYAVTSQLLTHLFNRVETLWPEIAFFLTLLAALLLALIRIGYAGYLRLRPKVAASASLTNDPLPHG